MPRTAIDDTSYELIKAHILTPDQSPLTEEQQEMFNRIMSAARVLDKNPVSKNAVALHLAKYPEIGRSRAYLDVSIAKKLFNSIHTFDFDFWQTWLINDIVGNINRSRAQNDTRAHRVIAMEHSNLIKAIGNRPEVVNDPRLTEKHQFYIMVQQNNSTTKIDFSRLQDLPEATLQELNRALFAGKEITDVDAEELFNT